MTTWPVILAGIALSLPASAATRHVGPGAEYATPCAAIAAAAAGDTILIDAGGNYAGDVCAWSTHRLTLRGVNGRPRIDAAGRSAQGKAIWVIAGDDTTVDNIEFSGCRVPDRNGAGIRQEGTNLTVQRSRFHDNENGILAGDRSGSTITIERSEFSSNGYGDGQSHNLYINRVDRLVFRYNWSHGARVGHLLKSRARENQILYNRLIDDPGGSASYELSLPSAGLGIVIGNLIAQASTTGNGAMLDYLSEPGSRNADDRLFVVNNTFVNHRGSGLFVQVGAATTTGAVLTNNLFSGGGTPTSQAGAVMSHNHVGSEPMFVDQAAGDFRLVPGAVVIDAGTDPGDGAGLSLWPTEVYRHPLDGMPRARVAALDIGACEWTGDAIFSNGFDG